MAERAAAGLVGPLQRVKKAVRRWQKPLLLAAIVAVIAGCVLSLENLELRWSDVQLAPLLAITAIVVPLSIAYSALNMMLMGHAAKVSISFRQGVKVSVFAQVAEILPIPGGALVRGAALVRAGSSKGRSAELVIAFSLLWIACGATGGGLGLAELGWPAHALTAVGALSALAICGWLAARFRTSIAAIALALRVLGVALVAWRFVLAFAVIGVAMPWVDSLSFAFATILGSAASLIPSGLGVSEGLSALIAQPAGVAPAAAFLAAALSRLLGFGVNMLLALAYLLTDNAPRAEPWHG